MQNTVPETIVALTADIVVAYLSFNKASIDSMTGLIGEVHAALVEADSPSPPPAPPLEPAVPVRNSVRQDHIVCLEDGAKLKMLKRYLMSRYNLTPDQYRARWNLPADYPMVAPDYSARRRALARAIGLGTRVART